MDLIGWSLTEFPCQTWHGRAGCVRLWVTEEWDDSGVALGLPLARRVWQLCGYQMVPGIIRRHVGLAALQAGRRVKSSVRFYQLVDTDRVIIPLRSGCWWQFRFFQCVWPMLSHGIGTRCHATIELHVSIHTNEWVEVSDIFKLNC